MYIDPNSTTYKMIATVAFVTFFVTMSVEAIKVSNCKRRRLQTFFTIVTLILAVAGLIYYYLFDKVDMSAETKIIFTGSVAIFYILLYILEHIRKKIHATMFAIFLNLSSICVVILTKR